MPNANIRANTITEKDTGRVVQIDNIVDNINEAQVTTSTGTQTVAGALDKRVIYVDTIEVTVGDSGEFPSINDAMDYLARRYPEGTQTTATIRLLSGFVMREQVLVKGRDFSWINIASDDSVVMIDKSFITESAGSEADYSLNPRWAAFSAEDGGGLPAIGCLFDMSMGVKDASVGRIDGIFLSNNSSAYVKSGCGIINADYIGALLMGGSRLAANGAVFSGSGRQGVYGIHSCQVSFNEGVADNCGWTAFQLQSSQGSCVDASLQNSGHYGCRSRNGSIVDALRVNVSGCADAGFNVYMGSHLTAEQCVCDNVPGQYGAIVQAGCTANFSGGSFKNCADIGIRSSVGSLVNASTADTTGTPNGFVCDSGSFMSVRGGVGTTNQPRNDYTNKGAILDDSPGTRPFREEGTWTPTLSGGSTAGSHSYTTRAGYFHRVGNEITVNWSIQLSSKDAAMGGEVRITGLPLSVDLTKSSTNAGLVSSITSFTTPTDFGGSWSVDTPANFLRVRYTNSSGSIVNFTSNLVSDSFRINGTCTYFVNALS